MATTPDDKAGLLTADVLPPLTQSGVWRRAQAQHPNFTATSQVGLGPLLLA